MAAELHDLIAEDLVKLYPDEIGDVRIRVIELQDHVLSMYDRAIGQYTAGAPPPPMPPRESRRGGGGGDGNVARGAGLRCGGGGMLVLRDRKLVSVFAESFRRSNIELVLNSRVKAVGPDSVTVVGKDDSETSIPFGACVWATGVAKHPLAALLSERLPPGAQVGAVDGRVVAWRGVLSHPCLPMCCFCSALTHTAPCPAPSLAPPCTPPPTMHTDPLPQCGDRRVPARQG